MELQKICGRMWHRQPKSIYRGKLPEGVILVAKRQFFSHPCLDFFVKGSVDERLYRDVAAEHGLDFEIYDNEFLIQRKRQPFGYRLPSLFYISPLDAYTKETVAAIDRVYGTLTNFLTFATQDGECSHHVATIYDRKLGSEVLESYLANKGFSKS